MSGTYLECDFCKKHFDLEGRNYHLTQAAKDAGWVEDGYRFTESEKTFCCMEHRRCYRSFYGLNGSERSLQDEEIAAEISSKS